MTTDTDTDCGIKVEWVRSREGAPLNIISGLWYQFTVKSIPNGLVTFEEEPREGHEGHLIQLALNDTEDFEVPEGPLQTQALWAITPTHPPSKDNEYDIRVLSHPEGKLTYSIGSSWGGRYMELDLTHPENYIRGGNMYYSSLWYLRGSEVPGYFTLHNSDPRRDPNFVTFSNESSERGQLMQIGNKDLHLYDLKGPFRNDALWSFHPQHYELKALVTNFQMEIPPDIEDGVFPMRVYEEDFPKDQESKVKVVQCSTEIPETFKLTFLQSFKPFKENNVMFDVVDMAKKLEDLKGKSLEFERKFNSNTLFVASLTTNYSLKESVAVEAASVTSNPESDKVKVRVYCDVIKEFEIPFKADVLVTATVDCARVDNGVFSKLNNFVVNDSSVIEHLLKFERFAGKIKEKPKSKLSKLNSNTDKQGVICEVGGRLVISCARRIYHKVL